MKLQVIEQVGKDSPIHLKLQLLFCTRCQVGPTLWISDLPRHPNLPARQKIPCGPSLHKVAVSVEKLDSSPPEILDAGFNFGAIAHNDPDQPVRMEHLPCSHGNIIG